MDQILQCCLYSIPSGGQTVDLLAVDCTSSDPQFAVDGQVR